MDMVDHFLLVAMAAAPAPVLNVEQETEILNEVGEDAIDQTGETMDLLDELEMAGDKGQVRTTGAQRGALS